MVTAVPGFGSPGRRRQLRASKDVTVLRCVQVNSFSVGPVAYGTNSTFIVSMSGTPPTTIRVVFHDGFQRKWTVRRDPWSFTFNRTYRETGTFHVSLRASNAANSITKSVIAVVEELISGLELMLRSPSSLPVPLMQVVTVEATVATGTGLSFVWDFGEGDAGAQYTTLEK